VKAALCLAALASAQLFPATSVVYPLIAILVVWIAAPLDGSVAGRVARGTVAIVGTAAIATGWASPPFVALSAITALGVPSISRSRNVLLPHLLFALSASQTFVGIVESSLGVIGGLVASPLILLATCFLTAPSNWLTFFAGAVATFLGAAACLFLRISPEHQQIISAIPAIVAIAWPRGWGRYDSGALVGWAGLAFLAASWIASPPSLSLEAGVLDLGGTRGIEGDHFEWTPSLLTEFQVVERRWNSIPEIPEGALVVVPLASADGMRREQWAELVSSGRARRLTLVVAGEHTNLSGIADRIGQVRGGISLRRDISVPAGNSDIAKGLSSVGASAAPRRAHINRGGTVAMASIATRPILYGDGWFGDGVGAGPDGRIGDYKLSATERRGRMLLAAASYGWPRLILVGDNSFLMHDFLAADPRAASWIVGAASLMPLFLSDLALVCWTLLALLNTTGRPLLAMVAVAMTMSILAVITPWTRTSERWCHSFIGQSGFDPRNFNKAMATLIGHSNSAAPLVKRYREPQSEIRAIPGWASQLHFSQVRDGAQIGTSTVLRGCRRVGSVRLREGPRLGDAQTCAVDGEAEILLGSREGAAVIRVLDRGVRMIVVLDSQFLSNRSMGTGNLEWLQAREAE
jgi:hypothetical protein